MTLPNILTVIRLLLIPVFAQFFNCGMRKVALVIYAIAALTDALDGYLARKLNQITPFGKLCDPLADKLMQLTMLYCLVHTGYVPKWIFIALIIRELYQIIGASYLLRQKNLVVWAELPGKISTVLFIVGIICVYPWHNISWLTQIGQIILIVALTFAVIGSVQYTLNFGRGKARPKDDILPPVDNPVSENNSSN